jgi:hypothetical protein
VTKVRSILRGLVVLASLVLLTTGCSEETPSRDHIPILKEKVYLLQQAVKEKNRAAIDSLLSPKILSYQQSSDSLLSFVYGPDDRFAFEQFGNCEIAYTSNRARIDCFVMDSTGRKDRPIVFTFVHKHDLWLLKRFEEGQMAKDSL